MRQTLFRIPLDAPWSLGPFGEFPGFGFGIVLAVWSLFGLWWIVRNRREFARGFAFVPPVVIWCVIAWVIIMVPKWTRRDSVAVIRRATSAIGRESNAASAYLARGQAWASQGAYGKAAQDYKSAIRVNPDFGPAYDRLAWLLATCPDGEFRDGAKAVEYATDACELTDFQQAESLDTLAAAWAESGQFEKAVAWDKKAAVLAHDSPDPTVRAKLAGIRRRLALFEARTPFRDENVGQSLPVYGYGFMLFIGLYAAIRTAFGRAKRAGFGPEALWDVAIWGFFSGIVGARLFYITQYADRVFAGCDTLAEYLMAAVNLPDGGLVLYGGVLMGVAAVIVYCRLKQLKLLLLADVIMPSVFVGLAFGRLGCLMNGCCYGDRCELPWAVSFPVGSVPDMALVVRGFLAPDDTVTWQLHPSQLYSSVNALVLAVLTHCYFFHRQQDGDVLALSMLTYPLTRVALEFLRGDELGQFQTSLTISQWISIALFSLALVYFFWLRGPGRRTPAGRCPAGLL